MILLFNEFTAISLLTGMRQMRTMMRQKPIGMVGKAIESHLRNDKIEDEGSHELEKEAIVNQNQWIECGGSQSQRRVFEDSIIQTVSCQTT